MFDVSKFEFIHADDVPALVAGVRAWDNAATNEAEGGSAYTAGVRTGADEAGHFYLFDCVRERVGTAAREALQLGTAEADGRLIAVRAPQDPGSAGKDVAFKFRQMLRGYQAETEPVTGSKVSRAHNYSVEVNRGRYKVVCAGRDADGRPVPPAWFKAFRDEHHYFPLSTTKDMVDAASDAHRHLSSILLRGLVVKGYRPGAHLVPRHVFARKFGEKIPGHWDVVAAVSIAGDSSRPSSWCVTARAAENAGLGEAVFVAASGRLHARDAEEVLTQLRAALDDACAGGSGQASRAWLSKESADVRSVSGERVGLFLEEFGEGATAGLAETGWYFQERPAERHPFTGGVGAPRAYLLVSGEQLEGPSDERGQLSARQELASWSYNERGEPQAFGGLVLNCVRMCLYEFALAASPLTREERREAVLREKGLAAEQVFPTLGTEQFVDNYWARRHELREMQSKEEGEGEGCEGGQGVGYFRRPFRRRRYHG
jgi:phage terminase large subunit-like protein